MPEPTEPEAPAVDLVIVVTGAHVPPGGKPGDSDIAGSLLAPTGEVLYAHMSSSLGWLRRDLTENFGRRTELDAKYPQGWTVSIVNLGDEVPAELIAANAAFYAAKGSDGQATA